MNTKKTKLRKIWFAAAFAALSVAFSGCGKEVPEGAKADAGAEVKPSQLNSVNFADSMKSYSRGLVKPQPWVGYWFPYTAGGIAGSGNKYDNAYVAMLRRMGRDVTSYDSVSRWELGNHSSAHPKIEPWFGHCNGWSASSLMVPEPRAPKSVEGIEFDVADQKALLAESWLEFSGDFVGTRVNDKGDTGSEAFWDVVPAQFHLMMVNVVGKQGRGLILDRHTGWEIWNQPLVGYAFDPVKPEDYIGAHPAYPNIHRINVTARIWWGNDNVGAGELTGEFDMDKLYDNFYDRQFPGRKLRYELWLDGPPVFDSSGQLVSSGNVLVTRENSQYVGGIWKNASSPEGLVHSHPDYLWVPFGRQGSSGYKNPKLDDKWVEQNIASEIRPQ